MLGGWVAAMIMCSRLSLVLQHSGVLWFSVRVGIRGDANLKVNLDVAGLLHLLV